MASRVRTLAAGLSDVGSVRQNNEDVLLLDPEAGFFVVCDGVGGHQAGEVAARLAADTVAPILRAGLAEARAAPAEDRAHHLLRVAEVAVAAAARTVWEASHDDAAHFGMATTLLFVAIDGSTGVMAHVGDSRLYLARRGEIWQLTMDHTFINELVIAGALDESRARQSPHRNVLTRCLGMDPDSVAVDVLAFDVEEGDRLLLCTDGLSDVVERSADLLPYLAAEDVEGVPQRLVDLAKRRGSSDNITVAVVAVLNAPHTERTRKRQRDLAALEKCRVCAGMSLRDRMKLLRLGRVVEVAAGASFCAPGEDIPGLSVILDGALVVAAPGETVRHLGPGAHFGTAALLEPAPTAKRHEAVKASRVLVIDAGALGALEGVRPQLAVKLLANVNAELRHAVL